MSGPAESTPRDLRIAPILVSIVYAALLAAGWAFTSLALDQDVIAETDAGPLLGPLMALAATLVVWAAFWGLRNRRSVGATVAAASALVYISMLCVGATSYSIARSEPTWFILFLGRYAPSPFVIVPAILAGLTVVTFWFVGGRSLPEKPFDRPHTTD